jgi:hypothetical protein
MSEKKLQCVLLIVFLIFLTVPLIAHPEVANRSTSFKLEGTYYVDDNKGFDVSSGGFAPISYTPEEPPGPLPPPDEGRDLGTGWGSAEIQVKLNHRVRTPFMTGNSFLTEGNNITHSFTGALTPVSARLELGTTLTPIAFFNVSAGAVLGTGWDIRIFNGMGLNADGTGVPESASFQGIVVYPWIGGTFQFDLGALISGEWTHIVVLANHRIEYSWFSGADRSEAWMFEADKGENFNGFKLFGSYFLGYRMPLVLDMAGVLLETSQNLGFVRGLSTKSSGGWGSDYVEITVSPVFSFDLSENSSLTLLIQFRRERLYTDATIFYNYYVNRSYKGVYWDLRRIAFSYSRRLYSWNQF